MDSWETIAKASELPSRSMKHVEIKGKEIAIINLDGKYHAINDRCGHMNAPLSKGEIRMCRKGYCYLPASLFNI